MADRVLFIGWNRPVIGREKQANQLFQKVMKYNAKLQADGRIESFEPVILSAHGGDLNGFILLKGSAQKLAEIREDNAFVDLVIEGGYCLEGYGIVAGYTGEGLTNVLSRWSKLLSD
jgi:hypothetical protein